MPKKITPKSQEKNKTQIPTIPIFNYFLTLKRYHARKYKILSFNCIMRIYSNVDTLDTLNYHEDKYLLVYLRTLSTKQEYMLTIIHIC